MTRLTRKEKSLTAAMIMLIIILTAMALSSCGVNYHLRKADRHLKKAEIKGAKISADTLWKVMEVPVPHIKVDTVLKSVSFRDTITVEEDRVITKIKYDTISRTMFVSTECPPDTFKIHIPVTVTKEIKSPRGFWYYFQYIAIALTVGFILGAAFWAVLRSWIKSIL